MAIPGSLLSAAKLCYMEDGSAFFTTQSLDKQTGDDWNDAPYEHNAGRPYDWRPDKWVKDTGDGTSGFVPNDEPRWEVIEVPYRADLETPANRALSNNSFYSVDKINAGAVPWLMSPDYAKHSVKVWAGTSLRDFIATIESLGGSVWLQVPASTTASARTSADAPKGQG